MPYSSFVSAATIIILPAGIALFLKGVVPGVEGHAYLMEPISRVLFYTPAFQMS